MKKRFFAIAMAVAICLSMLPAVALASSPAAFKQDYLKGGLSKAQAPYIVVEQNEPGKNAEFELYYFQTPELQNLALDIQKRGDEFWETYKLHALVPFIQIDVKFDNGKWLSEIDDWNSLDDWREPEYSDGIGDTLAFALNRTKYYDDADMLLSFCQTNFYHLGSYDGDDFLKPYIIASKDEYDLDRHHFDLANYTISYRIRWCIDIVDYETKSHDFLFGPWSEPTSIGKNGKQEALVKPTKLDAPVLSEFELKSDSDGSTSAHYFMELPDSIYAAEKYHLIIDNASQPLYIQAQMKVNGGEWKNVYTANPDWMISGYRATGNGDIFAGDKVQIRVRVETSYPEGNSEWSNIIGNVSEFQASTWAQEDLATADELGLIPDVLVGQDLTKPITRAEFAAVAVKLYENLFNVTAAPAADNPFTDTKNPDVLKAYDLGLVNGTTLTTFSPDVILSRQEAASLLARVYKKLAIPGWSLATNNDPEVVEKYKALFTMPAPFADDDQIGNWAKNDVYFMVAKGIISGVGNNKFAPKALVNQKEADTYGLATREQALKLAVGMAKKL